MTRPKATTQVVRHYQTQLRVKKTQRKLDKEAKSCALCRRYLGFAREVVSRMEKDKKSPCLLAHNPVKRYGEYIRVCTDFIAR